MILQFKPLLEGFVGSVEKCILAWFTWFMNFQNQFWEIYCDIISTPLSTPEWILVRALMYPHNGGISGFLAQWSRINEKCPRELRKTSVGWQQIPMITYSICKYSPNSQIIYLCTLVSGHFMFPCNVFIMMW